MIAEHSSSLPDNSSRPLTLNRQPGSPKLWMPRRVVITPEALNEPFGQAMYERIRAQGLPVEIMKNNRITGLRGADERETYRIAKIRWPSLMRHRVPCGYSPFHPPPTGR